jgi:hypothetical protein
LEAERAAAKIIGSQIVRNASATAELVRMKRNAEGQIETRKVRIPSDHQNTDYSPVYDKEGAAKRLHEEEDVPAEAITPEMIAQYEDEQEEIENDPNSWLYQ